MTVDKCHTKPTAHFITAELTNQFQLTRSTDKYFRSTLKMTSAHFVETFTIKVLFITTLTQGSISSSSKVSHEWLDAL